VADDLAPLPEREQRRRERTAARNRARVIRQQKWLDGANRRKRMWKSFRSSVRRGLTLAISLVGATLVSYGAWMISAPAGLIAAGLLLWVIQWNYGKGSDG
jgi:hypothetical protein